MLWSHSSAVHPIIDGILPKGLYPPCLRMADRALLAWYYRYIWAPSVFWFAFCVTLWLITDDAIPHDCFGGTGDVIPVQAKRQVCVYKSLASPRNELYQHNAKNGEYSWIYCPAHCIYNMGLSLIRDLRYNFFFRVSKREVMIGKETLHVSFKN